MNRQLNIDAALDSRIAALYCRLSRDDELQGDSNTQFFVDDGYSGTTFTRPDWQRLISMVDEGRVGTLIVKDLSRLGRDYLKVGYYTEIAFPEADVRFIAINNGVDSASQTESDFTPFLNIMKNISHSGKVSNDFSLFGRFWLYQSLFSLFLR